MAAHDVIRGRYRVEGTIGEGGAGTVYLAEDLRLPGRRCALKAFASPRADASGGPVSQFDTEAAVLARLDHPGLPRVSDSFDWQGVYYLVMDYVPGDDLKTILLDALSRGRRLDEHVIRRWAEDACDILSYLHGQQPPVVHRDIKPANIKLTPDGRIRIVDLGLAMTSAADEGRTVTVVAGGSRAYEPLEQAGGGHVDARADIYALGATLYHLLTGKAPASARERFVDPASLVPLGNARTGLEGSTVSAVEAAMALHPATRPQTASALKAMLSARNRSAGDGAAAVRANAWLIALLVTLLLAAFALSAWP